MSTGGGDTDCLTNEGSVYAAILRRRHTEEAQCTVSPRKIAKPAILCQLDRDAWPGVRRTPISSQGGPFWPLPNAHGDMSLCGCNVGQGPGPRFRALSVGQSLTLSELGAPHPLCILSSCPLPRGGGYALAVSGQLQVIRPHFEEVQQVWAAGDLHGQSHEAVEVLSERALAVLSSSLPIKPPGCWVGAPETHEHTHTSPNVCGKGSWRAEEESLGQGTLLRGSGHALTREVRDDSVLCVDLASLDGEHLL